MPPLLVVVTGPPGAGKSTLARALAIELQLPLVAKDELKETLFEFLPAGSIPETRALGRASFALLFRLAHELLAAGCSAIVEGNFSEPGGFATLPPARLVQLHLSAPPELLLERYRARARHPGHQAEAYEPEIRARAEAGDWRPLDLPGPLLQLDTSRPLDVQAVAAAILGA